MGARHTAQPTSAQPVAAGAPNRTRTPSRRAKRADLVRLARWTASEAVLIASEASPFKAAVRRGAPGVVVIAGENASGKSLFLRVMCAKAAAMATKKILPITVSIRERTGGGTYEMSRMRQTFMFGDEIENSTGANSVRVVVAAFRNLDKEGRNTLLALDEPELGLSDGYARALGTYIGEQARTVPEACSGVIVVTHSRSLVEGLIRGLGEHPTFAQLGVETADLDAWLTEHEVRSTADLLALPDVGLDRWRTLNKIFDDARR